MKYNRKVPITRVNKFFSQEDFNLEVDFGREWFYEIVNNKQAQSATISCSLSLVIVQNPRSSPAYLAAPPGGPLYASMAAE